MAELFIQCPGQPDQVVPLTGDPVTLGRGEDCQVFIAEKKASRRHVRIRPLPEGGAVAEDLGSSNGTWSLDPEGVEQRFLRRQVGDGDVIRIGDTRVTYRLGAPAGGPVTGAPLVSGTLDLQPTTPLPTGDVQAAGGTQTIPDAERPTFEPPVPVGPPPDRRGLSRALVLCGVAVAVFVGVELYLGARASRMTERKDAHLEALRILEHVDAGAERFAALRDDFARRYPNSPDLLTLDRYLDKVREREDHKLQVYGRLEVLLGQAEMIPASDLRFQLMQLQTALPDDEDFQLRVGRALGGLDRRRAEADLDAVRALEGRVQDLLDASRPSQAARLVRAYGNTHAGMGPDAEQRWSALEARVARVIAERFEKAWYDAEAEADPAKRLALLAEAYPALAGSPQGDRIRDRLRTAASMAAPRAGGPGALPGRPGATPPGTPSRPAIPSETEVLLARARKAEEQLQSRAWVPARAALAELVKKVDSGVLHAEWTARLGEVDQILGLVETLAEATDQEKKPRRKLSDGTWTVTAADPSAVTLENRKGASRLAPWSELPAGDVLALLAPKRLRDEQRHAVAVLAASLGQRQAFVDALVPIYEKGGDLAATDGLVARHLFGRSQPPEGGYRAYKGEILDQAGYDRRKEQERIEFLRAEAERLLALIAKEPVFKKLDRLRKLRDELDQRRRYALLAIFNTTHYPYPANKSSQQYQAVQQEIDRRVASAREIWEDKYRVRIKRAGQLGKHLDAWDAVTSELERREVDVAGLAKKIAPYTLYVTDEPLTIQTFFRSREEADWQAYNRWVMTRYNPARREVARDPEWRQVQITNEYRMLLGYTAVVKPGPAAYDAIDKDNVVKILDQAQIQKVTLLRALRIDNRLVMSARLHSEDMSKRGYFAHQAPPNPATNEGATGPADRMMKQGYHGWGYSENIAGSPSPQQAHWMWLHSSGHHRNILSGWTDLGSGLGGRNFTQNFGTGGGARPEVYPDTAIREREGGPRGGQGRRRRQ